MQQRVMGSIAEQMLLDACDRIEAMPDYRDERYSEDLKDRLAGAVAMLGASLGVPASDVRDDHGFDVAKAFVVAAAGDKHRAPSLTPSQFLHGIKRAVRECRRFPTFGLLCELARGRDVSGFPGDYLRDAEPTAAPEIAPEFEALARRWEKDSRERGLRPNQDTPRDIAMERLREFDDLMGRHFRMGEAPPPTPQPPPSRASYESEPGEDG